jgi:hypothetical protein
MKKLLSNAARQCIQHGIDVFPFCQETFGPCNFRGAPSIALRVEQLNQVSGAFAALLEPTQEILNSRIYDDFSFGNCGLTRGLRGLDDSGQIIDGVEVHVIECFDFRFDIAWHGKIDHEHRAVLARFDCTLHRT